VLSASTGMLKRAYELWAQLVMGREFELLRCRVLSEPLGAILGHPQVQGLEVTAGGRPCRSVTDKAQQQVWTIYEIAGNTKRKSGDHFISFPACTCHHKSRGSSVGIATELRAGRPRGRSLSPGEGSTMFTSPYRPVRLWGPPNVLSNGYRG
jgi:hypothetical protein